LFGDNAQRKFIEKFAKQFQISEEVAVLLRFSVWTLLWQDVLDEKNDGILKVWSKMLDPYLFMPRPRRDLDKPSHIFQLAPYQQPVKFLQDNILEIEIGFSYPRNCPLSKMYKKNVQYLFESGFLNQIFERHKHGDGKLMKELLKVIEEKLGYIQLDLTLLEAGFVIWAVSVAISILVFCGEIIYYYSTKKFKKTISKRKIKSKKKPVVKRKIKKIKRKCFKLKPLSIIKRLKNWKKQMKVKLKMKFRTNLLKKMKAKLRKKCNIY
jgi:hypothetical protein